MGLTSLVPRLLGEESLDTRLGTYKIDDNLLPIVHNLFIQVFSHCNNLYNIQSRSRTMANIHSFKSTHLPASRVNAWPWLVLQGWTL